MRCIPHLLVVYVQTCIYTTRRTTKYSIWHQKMFCYADSSDLWNLTPWIMSIAYCWFRKKPSKVDPRPPRNPPDYPLGFLQAFHDHPSNAFVHFAQFWKTGLTFFPFRSSKAFSNFAKSANLLAPSASAIRSRLPLELNMPFSAKKKMMDDILA